MSSDPRAQDSNSVPLGSNPPYNQYPPAAPSSVYSAAPSMFRGSTMPQPNSPPPAYEAAMSTASTRLGDSHAIPAGSSQRAPELQQHSTADTGKNRELDSALSSVPRALPFPSQYPRLQTPIALPQLTARSRLNHPHPFLRGHAPILTSQYGMSQADFIKIIDALNVCVAHATPFQAMEMASLGIGFIPEPVAMGVSAGLDVISGVGNEATMWWRVKKLLEKVNREIWHPRGLEMKVIKDTKLTGRIGVDRTKLLMDLGNVSDAQDTAGTRLEPLTLRRYRLLRPHVAELDLNVPAPATPATRNLLDKLSAKDQARRANKKAAKILKRQLKHDARLQVRAHRGTGDGSQYMLDPREEIKSNAMAYDDSAGPTSESESDSDDEGSVRRMARKTARADAKAAEINARFDEKMAGASSDEKREKIERERSKELDQVEREWIERRERFEKAQRRKGEERVGRNAERIEKAGKRLERLQWVVVMNREDVGAA